MTSCDLDILSGTADFTIEGWFLNPTGSSNNSFSPVSYGDAAASAGTVRVASTLTYPAGQQTFTGN